MALAIVQEGPARATVLKVNQTEPSRGFVAWQALVDGYAPKSSNDPAIALQSILADAQKMQGRTAWSLKVAEHKHQFKTIEEAQKTVVARETMPKDIQREFLTGARILVENLEKLEIATRTTARTTQSDQDASNHTSYDVCAIAWRGCETGKGAGMRGPNGAGT